MTRRLKAHWLTLGLVPFMLSAQGVPAQPPAVEGRNTIDLAHRDPRPDW